MQRDSGEKKKGKRMKIKKVVAAVIVDDGRIFATQRGHGEFKDGWEFPGGKIEPGETPQQALKREIREELDTEIEVGDLLKAVEYDYPNFHLSMQCFICSVKSGHLTLKEHEAAKWLTVEQIESVNWLPADIEVVRELRKYKGKRAVDDKMRK
jgi:8-oxo-dGTP diphosphatase